MRNAYVPPPHVGIQWPDGDDELSADAVDLISKLLAIEPTDRLGAKGADEVKAHPWFAGVDWANLRNTTSPFVPKLGKSEDTFYFEARNAIYHTTWEGDTSTQAEEGEEQESHVARVRNFSIINIPQLMTLNQSLVDEKQGTVGQLVRRCGATAMIPPLVLFSWRETRSPHSGVQALRWEQRWLTYFSPMQ